MIKPNISMQSHINLFRYSKYVFLVSFIIGTIIFLIFFFTSNTHLLIIGYIYLLITLVINLFFLVKLLLVVFKATNHKTKQSAIKLFVLLLLNFPVAIFYLVFTVHLLNTVRLTITNASNFNVESIKIDGIENIYIKQLKSKEETTLWLIIKRDCSIKMSYCIKDDTVKKYVAGYVTNNQGGQINYIIYNNHYNNQIFSKP